jgi:mannobiose 2-epimerase
LQKSKNWWAQAETMNTLLIMSELYPNDPHQYEKRFKEQWQFIKDYLIDWENGDWYESAIDQDPRAKTGRKSQVWKCNYHTSRSLINCINRINN